MTDRLTPLPPHQVAQCLRAVSEAFNRAANGKGRLGEDQLLAHAFELEQAARREAEAKPPEGMIAVPVVATLKFDDHTRVERSVMYVPECEREGPGSAAADLVPMQGPGHPMRCLLCGGKTEEYCGPVVHHVDCKHYVAPDPNARKMTADEIDALMGFDKPAPAADDLVARLRGERLSPKEAFSDKPLKHEAADCIEAQARDLAGMQAIYRERDRAANEALFKLKAAEARVRELEAIATHLDEKLDEQIVRWAAEKARAAQPIEVAPDDEALIDAYDAANSESRDFGDHTHRREAREALRRRLAGLRAVIAKGPEADQHVLRIIHEACKRSETAESALSSMENDRNVWKASAERAHAALAACRDKTIEECARVAVARQVKTNSPDGYRMAGAIEDAIRALKDKEPTNG